MSSVMYPNFGLKNPIMIRFLIGLTHPKTSTFAFVAVDHSPLKVD